MTLKLTNKTSKMRAFLIFCMAAFLAAFMLQFVSASGFNFLVYNPASIEREALQSIPKPNIISADAYPQKVMPGRFCL